MITGVILLISLLTTLRPSLAPWPVAPTKDHGDAVLRLRFLGTSSISLEDNDDSILLDGYFSRPGLIPLLLRPLHPDQQSIEMALQRAQIDHLSALLVAHTHFDHALDTGTLAQRFNAPIIGSKAIQAIIRQQGSHSPVQLALNGQSQPIGRFQITPILVPHAPGDIAKGAATESFRYPARVRDYPMGDAYAFLVQRDQCRILILPSAGQPGQRLHGLKADVALIGVGQLAAQGDRATETYWRDSVQTTGARVVIPIHWDDFTRPLDQPLRPMPYVVDRLDKTMARLEALAKRDGVTLRMPPAFEVIDLVAMGASHCA